MRALLVLVGSILAGWDAAYPCDVLDGEGPIDGAVPGAPVEVTAAAAPVVPARLDLAPRLELPAVEVRREPRLRLEVPASSAAVAAPRWDWVDTSLQLGIGLGLAADWAQTRQIVRDGREANPLIGAHGEHVGPGVYFPAVFAVTTATAWTLPRDWRRVVQGVLLGVEYATVSRNWYAAGRNPFRR
ncbi:MAG: hypothetical protein U0229_12200 [Anaeromyxobacter sp.]